MPCLRDGSLKNITQSSGIFPLQNISQGFLSPLAATRCFKKPPPPFEKLPKFDYQTYYEIFIFISFCNGPNMFRDDAIFVFIAFKTSF